MKKLLLAFALFLIPSLAFAQCNGVFPNNTICGNISGNSAIPVPVPNSSLTGIPGGSNGQIEYNNAGNFGGFTMSGEATTNTSTGVLTINKAITPTWTGTHIFSNGTLAAQFGPNAIVGINNGGTTPTVPLQVGDITPASSGANVVSARTSTGTTAVHGFAENSSMNLSAAGQGMDSYDARMTITGTQNYDHSVSYQGRTVYGSAGTMTNMYGGFDGPTVNSGTVTNQYGWYAALPGGGGTITNAYGFYAEQLTRGTTANWAFYSNGTTPSRFGGQVFVVGGVITGASTVAGLPTCNAGIEAMRYYVTDQNTAVAYRGAVTGGGATRQAVLCSNNVWIQD